MNTEQVQLTTEHIGRVWVERYVVEHMFDMRNATISKVKPVERATRYVIVDVKPADEFYYRNCPQAGPRVEVSISRIRKDGGHGVHVSHRWLPTTGHTETVEIEAL